MKFSKYLSMLFLFAFSMISAQNIEIKGNVTDGSGNLPMPGVNVVVKNSSRGTTTDFDGNYSIKVNSNEVLVFSYVGYESQEVAVSGTTTINVTLKEEDKSLDEVVVVGYGTQKKSVVTGAISSLKAKDIENVPNGRVEQALQGRTSGVIVATNSGQPGSAATIRVRGITTFDTYGGNSPIWVIDGIVMDSGAIGAINQSDIESLEVLKDASSLAIYGARAAPGVILVTTKKGSQGKLSVNYNGFTGTSSTAKKLKLLNATEYGALMNEKFVNSGASGSLPYPNLSSLGRGTDWQNAIFNDSADRYSHELSVAGGNNVSNFYLSFGTLRQEGIVLSEISKFARKNIRLNSTHKINSWLTVGQTAAYVHTKSVGLGNTNSEFGGPLSSAINLDPITPLVVTDPVEAGGQLYSNPYIIRDNNGNPYGISSVVGQEMTNPLAYLRTRLGQFGWSDDFLGNVFVELQPIKDLKFKSSMGTKLAYWGAEGFNPMYYLSQTVNNVETNNINRRNNKSFSWNIENTISYNKSFKDHNINVLLGQGAYKENDIFTETSVTYTGLSTNNYWEATFNDPTITLEDRDGYTFNGVAHVLTSLFGRLNYNYKERYLFEGVYRRDGSSRFGDNKKYGVFPAFSLGWNVSNENFWVENKYVQQLKLRGGHGKTGNDAIQDFGYLAIIEGNRNYTVGPGNSVEPGSSPGRIANPDLQWESTAQTNIGLESRILNDFRLSFDWFKKETSGILRANPVPGYVGSDLPPLANVADMTNSGIEIELGYRKSIKDFNISVNANFSTLKNEVTFLGSDIEFITDLAAGFQSMGAITRTQVGQAYNTFYGFQTAGIFQTTEEINAYTNSSGGLIQPNAVPGDFRWVDVNGDGVINDDDKTFLGSPLPKATFGLTLNLDYKGFDFTAFAQGAAGNKIFQGLRRLDILDANYSTEALDRWTGPGTSNNYPRLTNNDTNGNFTNMSDFYLEDGDYLRLKIIQLGYTIPKDLTSRIGVERLRLYVTGENLLTLTKYSGYDPEIGGNIMGVDRGYYPQAKSYLFGAMIQF